MPKEYLCATSKNSIQQFCKEDFQRFCIKLTMFKLFLAIIFADNEDTPPFEQILIRHTQGLFECNI